jgi:hypothetical protein
MVFIGMWNMSLYRAGSLMTVLREWSRYRLDLVGVQEVRWDGSGTKPAAEYTFFYWKGNENHELGSGFIVHKRIISAIERVEFVNDRMSYITLRDRRFGSLPQILREVHKLRVFENRVRRRIFGLKRV